MIIAFEGGEGSGKGTQIKLLAKALTSLGHKIHCIVEPGGTPTGQAIREVLLNRKDLDIFGKTEVFLFSGSRAQQVEEEVIPKIMDGYIILSDRSYHSTEAYQGYGRGVSLKTVHQLTDIAIGETKPDMVVLLDISPEIGLKRKKTQNEINRLDAETMEFHQKVRKGYLELAQEDPEKWVVINGEQTVEEIYQQVLTAVLKKLS